MYIYIYTYTERQRQRRRQRDGERDIIITHYPGFTIANMYFSIFFITTYLYFVHSLHHITELLFHRCAVAGVVKAVVHAVLSVDKHV